MDTRERIELCCEGYGLIWTMEGLVHLPAEVAIYLGDDDAVVCRVCGGSPVHPKQPQFPPLLTGQWSS